MSISINKIVCGKDGKTLIEPYQHPNGYIKSTDECPKTSSSVVSRKATKALFLAMEKILREKENSASGG